MSPHFISNVCVYTYCNFVASARRRYQTLSRRAGSRWSIRAPLHQTPSRRIALLSTARARDPGHPTLLAGYPTLFPLPCLPRVKRTLCSCCSTSPPDVPTPWDVSWYEQHIVSSLLFLPGTCPLIRQHQCLLKHLRLDEHGLSSFHYWALVTAAEFLYPNILFILVLGHAYRNLSPVAVSFICAGLKNAYFTFFLESEQVGVFVSWGFS